MDPSSILGKLSSARDLIAVTVMSIPFFLAEQNLDLIQNMDSGQVGFTAGAIGLLGSKVYESAILPGRERKRQRKNLLLRAEIVIRRLDAEAFVTEADRLKKDRDLYGDEILQEAKFIESIEDAVDILRP